MPLAAEATSTSFDKEIDPGQQSKKQKQFNGDEIFEWDLEFFIDEGVESESEYKERMRR